jgi:hypothetical protein
MLMAKLVFQFRWKATKRPLVRPISHVQHSGANATTVLLCVLCSYHNNSPSPVLLDGMVAWS